MKTHNLAGFKLSSPTVAAAGFQNGLDKSLILKKFSQLLDSEVGAITLGSFTLHQNDGNEIKFGPPVYFYDAKERRTYNSMGLSNIGMDQAIRLMPSLKKRAHSNKKVLIWSVSRSIEEKYGTAIEQSLRLVEEFLKAGADLVEVNLSTPNTVTKEGGRAPIMGLDLRTVQELVEGLVKIGNTKKVGFKMPPYLSKEEESLIPKMAELLKTYPIGFVTICNTIPNQIPRGKTGKPILSVPGGMGGMSGPATKDVGREQLGLWKQHLPEGIDIISLLGVDSAKEVEVRLKMGATAAGGVTFFRENLNIFA